MLTSGADPFDEVRSPASRWTRANIGEAIPGVPTPLTWSVWGPAMEHAFWWTQRQLGVAGTRERVPRVTGIALGHPAVSVDVSLRQIARLPGYDVAAFAEQYFGLPRGTDLGLDAIGAAERLRTLARLAWRAPWSLAQLRRRCAEQAAASERWWAATVWSGPPSDPLALLEAAVERFTEALAVHSYESIVCQGAYERAAGRLGPDGAAALHLHGELAEAKVAADLRAVAGWRLPLDAFLRRHGYHGPAEGELASPCWREDPAPVALAVAGLQRRDDGGPPPVPAPVALRGPTRALVAAARWLVLHRELGKAAFLRHLDVARFAARHLGEDAPWCTLEELRHGRPPAGELAARRRRHAALAGLRLPLDWTGDPAPEPDGAAHRPEVPVGPLEGVAASPGRVVGRVRLVVDPAALTEPIGPDEVLVARTTDPSWVTLFLTAGALVVDVGGVLSHGAIIARELGVPCVIGTERATTTLREGDLVEVDGDAGRVTVVEPTVTRRTAPT